MSSARPAPTATTNLLFSFQKYSIALLERDHDLELPPPRLVRRLLLFDRRLHPARGVRQLVAHGVERVARAPADVLVDFARQEDHAPVRGPADDPLLDAAHDVLVAE